MRDNTKRDALRNDFLAPPEGESDEFKAIWLQVVKDRPAEHFAVSDTELVSAYVHQIIRLRECRHAIDRDGLMLEDRYGILKQHPLMPQLNAAEKAIRSFAIALRVTPSSRFDQATPKSRTPKNAGAAPAEDKAEQWAPKIAAA